jgi:hypothetical protein
MSAKAPGIVQNTEQIVRQKGPRTPLPHAWKPGQSGNPDGRQSRTRRRQAMMADLAAELGGLEAMPLSERLLLERVADILVAGARRERDRMRTLNTIDRLLRQLRASAAARRAPPKAADDLDAYLTPGKVDA